MLILSHLSCGFGVNPALAGFAFKNPADRFVKSRSSRVLVLYVFLKVTRV